MLDFISPPVVVLEEVQKGELDEKYEKYKISRIKGKLKKLGQFFDVNEENTFTVLRKWNEYWSPLTRVEDLKMLAEIQAKFSRCIILPRSPVTVYEVWKAVDFDPADYVWIRDSWISGCENCIHTNLRTGRCVSSMRGYDCPDFYKYTAVDMLTSIARKQEAYLRNATLASLTDGGGIAARMFFQSVSLLDREIYEMGESVKELLRKYVVEFEYVEEGCQL